MIEKKNNHWVFFVGLSVGLLCTRIWYMLLSSLMMCFNKLFICLPWSHLYAVILFAQQQKIAGIQIYERCEINSDFVMDFKNPLTYLKKKSMSSFLYIHILNCILIIKYQINDEIAWKLDTLNSYVFEIKKKCWQNMYSVTKQFCFISVFQFLSNYTECLTNDLVTGLGMVVAIPMCGGRFKQIINF